MEHNAPMPETEHASTRRPPEVIRVPPPVGSTNRFFRYIYLGIVAFAVLLALDFGKALRAKPSATALVPNMEFWMLSGGVSVVLFSVLATWFFKKKIATLDANRPKDADEKNLEHPAARALYDLWRRGRVPKPAQVMAILKDYPIPADNDGRIVVLGDMEVPEVGERFFEPEIITPSDLGWFRVFYLGMGIVLCLLGGLHLFGVFPGLTGHFFRHGVGYLVVGAILMIWQYGVRTTYVRFAPGIIQVLRFPGIRKTKPRIRGYPVTEGTLMIISRSFNVYDDGKNEHTGKQGQRYQGLFRKNPFGLYVITLLHSRHKDSYRMTRVRNAERFVEFFWKAALSTARRPQLSDHDLVGS